MILKGERKCKEILLQVRLNTAGQSCNSLAVCVCVCIYVCVYTVDKSNSSIQINLLTSELLLLPSLLPSLTIPVNTASIPQSQKPACCHHNDHSAPVCGDGLESRASPRYDALSWIHNPGSSRHDSRGTYPVHDPERRKKMQENQLQVRLNTAG